VEPEKVIVDCLSNELKELNLTLHFETNIRIINPFARQAGFLQQAFHIGAFLLCERKGEPGNGPGGRRGIETLCVGVVHRSGRFRDLLHWTGRSKGLTNCTRHNYIESDLQLAVICRRYLEPHLNERCSLVPSLGSSIAFRSYLAGVSRPSGAFICSPAASPGDLIVTAPDTQFLIVPSVALSTQ
jgi:hypothetical protein